MDLGGVRVKLERAARLTDELQTEVAPLLEAAHASIEMTPSPGDASILLYVAGELPTVDRCIAALVGDIVHNLRSALDHLAWQLVLLDGGTPTQATQFPLRLSRTGRDGKELELIQPRIRDERIRQAVTRMQPFTEADYGHDPKTDSLHILDRLNIIDKHRLLLTVVHTIDQDFPAYWGLSDDDPSPSWWMNSAPLAPGGLIASFDFGGLEPPSQFDPHLSLAVTIGEEEAGWAYGRDLVNTMAGLRDTLAHEINFNVLPLHGVEEAQPL